MEKVSYKLPAKARSLFIMTDKHLQQTTDELVKAMNTVVEMIRSYTEPTDLNQLIFDLLDQNDFQMPYDEFTIETAVKLLANLGFIKLDQMQGSFRDENFEYREIISCHASVKFTLGMDGQILLAD